MTLRVIVGNPQATLRPLDARILLQQLPIVQRQVHARYKTYIIRVEYEPRAEFEEERVFGQPVAANVGVGRTCLQRAEHGIHAVEFFFQLSVGQPIDGFGWPVAPIFTLHRLVLNHHKALVGFVEVDEIGAGLLFERKTIGKDDGEAFRRVLGLEYRRAIGIGLDYLKARQVLQVIDRLNCAERPVLLAGNGIRLAESIPLFEELIQTLQIPLLTTWNGIDLIDDGNGFFYGRPGGLGHRYANFIQQNSDFFLSIGARLNLLQTGYNFDGFARGAFKVMVDIDAAELNKMNVRPDLPVCADAKDFISAMLRNKDRMIKRDRADWFGYCNRVKKKYPIVLPEYWKQPEMVNPYCLIETISDLMTADDIYVSGSSGSCIDISMQTFQVKKGQRVFCTKGLASMGYGLPSTIGACLASGGKRVVGVNGDGGFMMNIQELETIRRLNLPIKLFVLCNSGYGAIRATQANLFAGHLVACTEDSGLTIPSITKIAEAFGLKTLMIQNNGELREKVSEALEFDGPVICEGLTPIQLTAMPKQVSYKRKDGQMESKPLEFMNPPISDEEMRENMIIPMYEMK